MFFLEKKVKKFFLTIWPLFYLLLISLFFFSPVFKGKMPFPGDTLIGGYYPWRALSWEGRTTEYPLKQMSITDAANSFYPWRYLAIELMKKGKIPLWNRYEFSGTPLLASPSTAAFYPLNILFFLMPFNLAWTILVILQPLLGGSFFYLFLRNKNLTQKASLLGSLCFSFGSYFLLSSEFNVLGHTALWLPLALLAIDKLIKRPGILWFLILISSLTMSILAGFIQFVFYGYLLLLVYAIFQVFNSHQETKKIFLLIISGLVFALLLSGVQVLPFLDFLKETGRVEAYGKVGLITRFFVPFSHLVMFFVPDFFGNPGTKNYWGQINYYEFCGYFGIVGALLIFYLIYSKKKNQEINFWFLVSLISLFLTIRNPISSLPYNFKIPLLASLLPSRLLLITSLSFSVLAAFGFDKFYKSLFSKDKKKTLKKLIFSFTSVFLVFLLLGGHVLAARISSKYSEEKQIIALRNMVLPFSYLSFAGIILGFSCFLSPRKRSWLSFLILVVLSFDLCRQGRKFLSFIDQNLVFPEIKTTRFLKENLDHSRFIPLHQEIFGTNHQTVYGLESAEGYNPLHSRRYSIFISQGQRETPTDRPVRHFERTVYGRNYQANIFKLLSVKYFLSFDDLEPEGYPLVFKEGKVGIYENTQALPRVFLACDWEKKEDPLEIINGIISQNDPSKKLFLEKDVHVSCQAKEELGKIQITNYSSDRTEIDVSVPNSRILVFGNAFYPGWRAFVDGVEGEVLRVDYALTGLVIPAGRHEILFKYDLLSFKIGLFLSSGTLILLILGITGLYCFRKEWW